MAEELDLGPVQGFLYLHRGLRGEVFLGSLEEGPTMSYRRTIRVTSSQSLILEGAYCRITDGQVEAKTTTGFKAGQIVNHLVEYSSSGQRVELKYSLRGWFQQLSSLRSSHCEVLRFFGQNHVPLAYFSWLSPDLAKLFDTKKALEFKLIRMEQAQAHPIRAVREESVSSSQIFCLRMYSQRNDLEFPETLLTYDRQTGRLLQTKGYMYPPPYVGQLILSYPP